MKLSRSEKQSHRFGALFKTRMIENGPEKQLHRFPASNFGANFQGLFGEEPDENPTSPAFSSPASNGNSTREEELGVHCDCKKGGNQERRW
ncbi:hypothetical protein B9Z55_026054 [Caenorhabditis nigoni]|uniref:Uncharacterized protein n=1 Tax=Caenorhabditis nigoni TaxID=1611254 RepID=A0A2G5T119_9PELO|nr:hypothetical protein B9Z55_026054 [Caenorhabditis nigoni]